MKGVLGKRKGINKPAKRETLYWSLFSFDSFYCRMGGLKQFQIQPP